MNGETIVMLVLAVWGQPAGGGAHEVK
jgi:hypothetical protein